MSLVTLDPDVFPKIGGYNERCFPRHLRSSFNVSYLLISVFLLRTANNAQIQFVISEIYRISYSASDVRSVTLAHLEILTQTPFITLTRQTHYPRVVKLSLPALDFMFFLLSPVRRYTTPSRMSRPKCPSIAPPMIGVLSSVTLLFLVPGCNVTHLVISQTCSMYIFLLSAVTDIFQTI